MTISKTTDLLELFMFRYIQCLFIPSCVSNNAPLIFYETQEITAGLSVIIGGKVILNEHPKLQESLLHFEERQVPKGVKIGVLLKLKGQHHEEEWFNNQHPTPAFEEFLNFLGKKEKLKGFTRYRGGLDVNSDSTGTHTYATTYEKLSIVFHVSTCLPYFPKDPQQLERKRHLGNDIVILIFNESDEPLDPSLMKSEFNQVCVVVGPAGEKKTNQCTKLVLPPNKALLCLGR